MKKLTREWVRKAEADYRLAVTVHRGAEPFHDAVCFHCQQSAEDMKTKPPKKPYWEMTTAELREATKQFDEGFVGDKARPLTPEMKARWERAKAKGASDENGSAEAHIAVRLDKTLLKRCTALAKKKRLSRDALIARGLRALLAAEGE